MTNVFEQFDFEEQSFDFVGGRLLKTVESLKGKKERKKAFFAGLESF